MTETTIIAEYGDRFDADLAVAKLLGHGIIASTRSDPAASIAPHLVTDRVFRVAVHIESAEDARTLLQSDPVAADLDSQFYVHGFAQRPSWVKNTTLVLLIAVAGPVIATTTILAFGLLAYFMP